jgi:hypothetical protein
MSEESTTPNKNDETQSVSPVQEDVVDETKSQDRIPTPVLMDPRTEQQALVSPQNDLIGAYKQCYDEVKEWIFGDQDLSSFEMIHLSMRVMKLVEKFKGVSGEQKKSIVIRVLRQLVVEHPYKNEDERASVRAFVDGLLPILVDVFVAIARGRLDIGKRCNFLKRFSCKK